MQTKWFSSIILSKTKSISNIHWHMHHDHTFNIAFAYKLSHALHIVKHRSPT